MHGSSSISVEQFVDSSTSRHTVEADRVVFWEVVPWASSIVVNTTIGRVAVFARAFKTIITPVVKRFVRATGNTIASIKSASNSIRTSVVINVEFASYFSADINGAVNIVIASVVV